MLEKTEESHPGVGQAAIEKDWWVSVTLKALFQTGCAGSLIFKGGTSLSKGWGLIERFSEDIDLAISHSFFGINKSNKSHTFDILNYNFCPHQKEMLRYGQDYEEKLRNRMAIFKEDTKTRKSLVTTMVTTYGVLKGVHSGIVQNEVLMDDLFK